MNQLPDFLEQGEVARLIPVANDSQREDRATSIFLAGLMSVDDLAKALLGGIGQRIGARTKISCYTQVVYKNPPGETKYRPDGLIEVINGSRTWRALVEGKIANASLEEDQIRDYLQIARLKGVDAVITLSNQFATLPTHHPVKFARALPKGVSLFHWSWMYILTEATLLLQNNEFAAQEQHYILSEIVRHFEHHKTGISGFDRMNPEWKGLVVKVQTGARLNKTSEEVMATVAAWHQETRDLCLILSRALGRNVRLRLSRAHARDAAQRLRDDSEALTQQFRLAGILEVPNAASPLTVTADLRRRCVICSMTLNAPGDRISATARTNWLLRQLKDADSADIHVTAHWPRRSAPTQASLQELHADPKILEAGKHRIAPYAFDVVMVRDLAGKFSGRMTFISLLEAMVPEFYAQVGQHLRAWVPPPPKIEPKAIPEPAAESRDEVTLSEPPAPSTNETPSD